MSEKYAPSITATKLYERTSTKGNTYFSGRLGGLRIAIIKTAEVDETGNPIWLLRLSEAPPYVPQQHDNSASGPAPVKPPPFAR